MGTRGNGKLPPVLCPLGAEHPPERGLPTSLASGDSVSAAELLRELFFNIHLIKVWVKALHSQLGPSSASAALAVQHPTSWEHGWQGPRTRSPV